MNDIRKRVVLIEDDVGLRRAIERLMQLAGYDVRAFAEADGPEAYAYASNAACLVLDVQLPGISGPAFYSTLPVPRPPVVFITAFDTQETHKALLRTGVHRLLVKPFLGSDLLKELIRAMTP